jgi:hypothetical protein
MEKMQKYTVLLPKEAWEKLGLIAQKEGRTRSLLCRHTLLVRAGMATADRAGAALVEQSYQPQQSRPAPILLHRAPDPEPELSKEEKHRLFMIENDRKITEHPEHQGRYIRCASFEMWEGKTHHEHREFVMKACRMSHITGTERDEIIKEIDAEEKRGTLNS